MLDIAFSGITGGYSVVRSGPTVVVTLDACTLSQGLDAYDYVVLSSSMPKPVKYSCSTIKLQKQTTGYAVETVLLAVGIDGVITINNANGAGGVDSGNVVLGQLVYMTDE